MIILFLFVFFSVIGVLYSALIVGKWSDEKMQLFKDKKVQESDRCFREKSSRKGETNRKIL